MWFIFVCPRSGDEFRSEFNRHKASPPGFVSAEDAINAIDPYAEVSTYAHIEVRYEPE